MKLVFNMESWEVCGGGIEFFGEEVLVVGNKYIDKVLEILVIRCINVFIIR